MPCVVATYLFLEERAEVAQSPWRTFAPWRKTPEEAETRRAFGAAIMVCFRVGTSPDSDSKTRRLGANFRDSAWLGLES